MQIKSLGFRTNLIFSRFSGTVLDEGSFTLIQTPCNPNYYWGNYIIFDRPPKPGDFRKWTALFDRKFNYYSEPHHYIFAWEDSENQDPPFFQEFLDAGFEYATSTVLNTQTLNPPLHPNEDIEVRKIATDKEWREVFDLQVLCAKPKYLNDHFLDFKEKQIHQYRSMSQAGLGHWYGAYLHQKMVGDLGIYFEKNLGRYQSVGTHPAHRRQGICGTLVYEAGQMAFAEFGIQELVMEADPFYHAARIYESVGFRRTENNHSLSWWTSIY